jgi:hypothetical protein
MTYKIENSIGSPRLHFMNKLKENNIYSEFPKEWFKQVLKDEGWYYFVEELIEKDFKFKDCINPKTSWEFMKLTWYSRPKINTYIEKHWRIVFLNVWYYDLENLKTYLKDNMKEWIEKRGRPTR